MIPQRVLKKKKKKSKGEIRFGNFLMLFGLLPALLVLHLHAIAITVLLAELVTTGAVIEIVSYREFVFA